ncbi:minor tail protein [Microbacterium phage MementoMori]|uniref:Minor tail protein n=1 Tax=Microbacterium phage MementoMori TaxID=2201436 RepID=A0A2Z4Q5E5_9CAUD|nr:minor tail protein [Microbacterium phage MementoMori]AWY05287.1 minor tail protein [Microbacterium phage MementoMori]
MSAYEGYLSLGGNEIVNNARVRGYAETAQCPMWWLRGPYCASMADALGQEVYSAQTMNDAPWYDTDTPDRSRRFFGAFATSITGVYDSTRSASVVEGVDDGGRVGRVRKRARQVKVKALLMAQGRDALEYGMAWMNAALDPGACGQHGDTCGSTDLEFFVDCPPARGTVQEWTAWLDAARNLYTYPSFEASLGTTEARRNECTNPQPTSVGAGTPFGWGGATATVAAPWNPARLAARVNANGASTPYIFSATANRAFVVGDIITIRAKVRASKGYTFRPHIRTGNYYFPQSVVVSNADAPTWRELVLTFTTDRAIAAADGLDVSIVSTAGSGVVGEFLDMGDVLIEKVENTARQEPYFDGGMSPDSDLTPSWVGAANASASILSGARPIVGTNGTIVAVRSGQWAESGDYSLRLMPRYPTAGSGYFDVLSIGGLERGKTYTALATVRKTAATGNNRGGLLYVGQEAGTSQTAYAPNAAGEHKIRITFTVGATGYGYLRVYHGGAAGEPDIWFDDLAVVEGAYDGEFFDGSTEGDDFTRYVWAGTPEQSTTTMQTRQQFDRPQTDAEYAPFVDEARRYLHNVVAVSGPLITAEYEVNGFHAYEVEIVFVAERPWVYSVTRPVELPTTASTVVEDIAHNLTPFPSAERPGEEVLTALNLSTNPSAETNLTGWTSIASIVSGADPAPYLAAMDRSGEKFAAGIWSVRRRLLGTATVASGRAGVLLSQVVALGARPANTRYSVNIWGALTNQGGSGTVLRELRAYIIWSGGAGRTDQIALTTDPAVMAEGLPFIAKSILPPAGATQANVVLRGEFDWASGPSPSDIRIYADALALTIP